MQHQSTDLTILRNLNILYRCHKWQKWQTMRKMALRKISWNIQTIMFKNSISYYSCVQQGVFTYLENTYKKWKLQRTRNWWFFIVLWGLERAWNDLYNPESITLIISVMNSGLWRSFQAPSNRHRTMKNRQIRFLIVGK